MTQCARDTISIVVLAMQLLFFIILGTAAANWSAVTDGGLSLGG